MSNRDNHNQIEQIVAAAKFYPILHRFTYLYTEKTLMPQPKYLEMIEQITHGINHENLIDLGCGNAYSVLGMFRFIKQHQLEIARYYAVDIEHLHYENGVSFKDLRESYGIRLDLLESDMLEFLSGIECNSANITINGIDDNIFNPFTTENRPYMKKLINNICRVIGANHIAFGIYSEAIFTNFIDLPRGFSLSEYRGYPRLYLLKHNRYIKKS